MRTPCILHLSVDPNSDRRRKSVDIVWSLGICKRIAFSLLTFAEHLVTTIPARSPCFPLRKNDPAISLSLRRWSYVVMHGLVVSTAVGGWLLSSTLQSVLLLPGRWGGELAIYDRRTGTMSEIYMRTPTDVPPTTVVLCSIAVHENEHFCVACAKSKANSKRRCKMKRAPLLQLVDIALVTGFVVNCFCPPWPCFACDHVG